MANGDEPADAVGPGADATAATPGQGGPPSGPPGGGPPGGMPGGGGPGPILAALARRQGSPRPSAPGPGDTASSMNMLMQAVAMIQHAIPGLPAGSPMHKDALKAAMSLSRHAGQGQPTAGIQQTQLQDLLRSLLRNTLLQRIMAQRGQQGPGGGGGAPGGPGGAMAAAAPPMPSTPLPGA